MHELVGDQVKILPNGIAVLENDTHISRWIEQNGNAFDCPPNILDNIHAGDIIVDVGAFIGDYTVPFARKAGPLGHVFAFEPNPEAYICLVHNTAGMNVTSACIGLANDTGFIDVRPYSNAGASWLIKDSHHGRTAITKLDLFGLSGITFMKIDCEGYEYEVLLGASETIKKCHPRIVIELNSYALSRLGRTPENVVELLNSMGYRIMDGWQGQLQIDVLAERAA